MSCGKSSWKSKVSMNGTELVFSTHLTAKELAEAIDALGIDVDKRLIVYGEKKIRLLLDEPIVSSTLHQRLSAKGYRLSEHTHVESCGNQPSVCSCKGTPDLSQEQKTTTQQHPTKKQPSYSVPDGGAGGEDLSGERFF